MTRVVKTHDFDDWTLTNKEYVLWTVGDGQYGMFGDVQQNSVLFGQDGNDLIYGVFGDDYLAGGAGDDSLYGGYGKDVLFGGLGNDHLYGDNGNDYLNGGQGSDILFGGQGRDVFAFNLIHAVGPDAVFNPGDNVMFQVAEGYTPNMEADMIMDFDVARDSIRFTAGENGVITTMTDMDTDWFNANVHLSDVDGNTLVSVGDQAVVYLMGVDVNTVEQDMFLF